MQQPTNGNEHNENIFRWNMGMELPLSYPCQIYPRVSTPEQKKNVSAEMQKDKTFALSCGWTEDLIILDTRDLGISGQVLMENRLAFNQMLRRIAKGEIKAVVVVNVDRLFRDKWGAESGKFMEICFKYGVLIVTPDFIYDFRISWHIERFKRRCEEAWNYLEYHVYGRLLPAQDRRARAGYWSGGSLPMGYILDMRQWVDGKRNPDYYRYIVYEPHAEIIRWIFRKFKELHGNVMLTMVEIEKKAVLFPDFEEWVDPFLVRSAYPQYTKVEGGYTIVSNRGLRRMLTNRVYIGCWIYKGELISTEYPDPIVDIDLFTYAYKRLSPVNLDGTPNEEVVTRQKSYAKRHYADKPAILKECIQSEDPKVKIYAKERKQSRKKDKVQFYYGFYHASTGSNYSRLHSLIVAPELDAIVMQRLRWHLQKNLAEKEFENFTEFEGEVVKEESETLNDIIRDIDANKALMARIKEEVGSGKLTNPELLEAANTSYSKAAEDLRRLEARKTEATAIANEDQERRSYRMLMQEVGDAWDEIVLPEEHPRLVYLFIRSVTLAMIAPHFFTVKVEWHDSSWGIDTGLCYKGTQTKSPWTKEEITIVKGQFETAKREELLRLLPNRSYQSICQYVLAHGLASHRIRRKEEGIPHTVSLNDWQVMRRYDITEADIQKWGYVKLIQWAGPWPYIPSF